MVGCLQVHVENCFLNFRYLSTLCLIVHLSKHTKVITVGSNTFVCVTFSPMICFDGSKQSRGLQVKMWFAGFISLAKYV